MSERLSHIKREIEHAKGTAWPAGDSWIRGYAEDCGWLVAECARLTAFVSEIAEDDWYAFGADRTDVQTAARRLLGLESDPYD